jgi:hypothetical protein
MSEQIEGIIEKIKGGITLTNVRLGLFDIQGNILYSSLGEKASDIASKLTKGAFEAWDVGDYQVKRLEKGCLLISRVTPKLALALDSYEREGLVIVAMGALIKKFANEFNKIDEILPGKPISAKIIVAETEAPKPIESPPEPTPEPIPEPAIAEPPTPVEKEEVTPSKFIDIKPESVLIVSKSNVGRIEMDPMMLSLIRIIDGVKPIKEITKLAGLDFKEATPKLVYLVQQGVLKFISDPEADNLEYQFVYELIPPYTVENVAEKACAGRSDEVVTVMSNLDKGYTINQLSTGLKKVDLEKEPKEVLEILRFYEGRDVVRIKKLGPEDPDPNWLKNPEYQSIYDFVQGMNFEEVNKKLLIADRKTLIILRNLDLNISVLWFTLGIRGMGLDTNPAEILSIMNELQNRGVIRKIK